MSTFLAISEVARRSGVAASALRYYEELGLIQAERNESGHRRYARGVLRRVAFIVFAQKIGLTLDEVSEELRRLPSGRAPEGPDWAQVSKSWSERIDERIAELQRMRGGLTRCIGCGCLSLAVCQFVNPPDRVGQKGAGPRFWIDGKPSFEKAPLVE